MDKCCAKCRFWVEGVVVSDGYGWCNHEEVKAAPAKFINGQFYDGGAGVETYAAGVCEKYQPAPVRFRKPS